MKLRNLLCCILIFLSCSLASTQNKEPRGIELCKEVHTFLKKSGFSPLSQSLIVSGENTFPYNIIVTFNGQQKSSPENLLLIFFQEDILKNQELIKNTLNTIKEAGYPFTITVLFAYGEKQQFEKADMIYGTQVFLDNLNTNLSYTALIFDLESQTNVIESSASGMSSPPWLIKTAMNLYKICGIGKGLPRIIISQLSSYKFIKNRVLNTFFTFEIPAIKLSLGNIKNEKKASIISLLITNFIDFYSKNTDSSWERHFMIVKLFGRYHTVSEKIILHIVVPVIFFWLTFIFLLIFVNRRLKRHTWSTIGKIWWSVPLTYLLLVSGFFVAAALFQNLFSGVSYAAGIYGQLIFQIVFSLFICLSVYLIILNINYSFNERAIDYLLVISCFINQSIFILSDISLSPIFIIICFLSLLALSIKNNYLHIAVFLMMIAPLVPYGHRMISSAQLSELSAFILNNKSINFIIPLVLYPVYLVLFRIITSIRSHKKIRFVIIFSAAAFIIISSSLSLLGILRSRSLNKKEFSTPEVSVSELGDQLISISFSDEYIFDDIIRTVNISIKRECLLCDLTITTDSVNPVLYSDNDYTNPSVNTVRFRTPDNPPQEMSFKYGAAKAPCRITVSAVIEDLVENSEKAQYLFISRSLEAGEK